MKRKKSLLAIIAIASMALSSKAQTTPGFTIDSVACEQSVVTVANTTTTSSNSLTYEWSFQNSNYWSPWQGQNPPANLKFFGGGTHIVTLNVTDTATFQFFQVSHGVNVISQPQLTCTPPSQNINLCAGDSILVTYGGATTYEWWENGQVINNTDSMWFNHTSNYLVVGTDQYGCSTSNYNSVYVETPPQFILITQQGWTQTILPAGNQTVDLCDQGTSSLIVNLNGGAWGQMSWNNGYNGNVTTIDSAGSYYMTMTTQNGCQYTTDTTTINLLPSPTVQIHATPEGPYCYDATVTVVCNANPGATQYMWFNGNQIPQTTQSITVNSAAFGAYIAYALGTNGCWGMSQSLNINFNLPVPQPYVSVSPNGQQAISTGGYVTYQWYMDTLLLAGQTSQYLGVTNPGFYFVVVTDQYGCSAIANPVYIMPLFAGIVEIDGQQVSIYPTQDYINLLLPMNGKVYDVKINDRMGTEVFHDRLSGAQRLNLDGLKAGLYFLTLASDKEKKTQKIMFR